MLLDERGALRVDAFEQRRERVRELLDALTLERVGDVVVVDARVRELRSSACGLVDPSVSVSATTPWSWNASIVSNGIVFTVSGPISSST
jgi:hypothetical protein